MLLNETPCTETIRSSLSTPHHYLLHTILTEEIVQKIVLSLIKSQKVPQLTCYTFELRLFCYTHPSQRSRTNFQAQRFLNPQYIIFCSLMCEVANRLYNIQVWHLPGQKFQRDQTTIFGSVKIQMTLYSTVVQLCKCSN